MKRVFVIVLMVMLLMPAAYAQRDMDAFYETLGDYILYHDRLLSDELFVYDYVEAFYEERTFDNLNIARMAVQSALREIRNMEMPVFGISEEDTVDMMVAGIEADALMYTIEGVSTFCEESIIRLESLFDSLLMDVYYEPALDNLAEKIELYRQDAAMNAQSVVHLMEYLLIQVGDEDRCGEFRRKIRENTETVSGAMSDAGYDDILEIAEAENELLDRVAENIDKIQKNSGFREVIILLLQEAVDTGDVSALISARTEIAGEYETFPEAWWMSPEMGEYLYIFPDPETEELFFHTMGNDIVCAPDRIKMTFKGVEGTDAVDYLALLMSYGIPTQHELTEEEGVQKLYVLANKGESTLMLIWSEEETFVYLSPPLAMTVPIAFYGAY